MNLWHLIGHYTLAPSDNLRQLPGLRDPLRRPDRPLAVGAVNGVYE
jgi:hypothetical protein